METGPPVGIGDAKRREVGDAGGAYQAGDGIVAGTAHFFPGIGVGVVVCERQTATGGLRLVKQVAAHRQADLDTAGRYRIDVNVYYGTHTLCIG